MVSSSMVPKYSAVLGVVAVVAHHPHVALGHHAAGPPGALVGSVVGRGGDPVGEVRTLQLLAVDEYTVTALDHDLLARQAHDPLDEVGDVGGRLGWARRSMTTMSLVHVVSL